MKLRRALFGETSTQRYKTKSGVKVGVKQIKPKFKVKKLGRGLVEVPNAELKRLQTFLKGLNVKYEPVERGKLLGGIPAMKFYGLNVIGGNAQEILIEDGEMLKRSFKGKIASLEDTLAYALKRSLEGQTNWLVYIVMSVISNRLDVPYLRHRCKRLGVWGEMSKLLSLIDRTFKGKWRGDAYTRIAMAHPLFRYVQKHYLVLHPRMPKFKPVDRFMQITPETVVESAGKQIFGW
jgi:hypothetical protein